MKRIAVVVTEFIAGGVEKALLKLIDAIDRNEYEITVFLPNKNGQWTYLLEEKVDVEVLQEVDLRKQANELLKKLDLFQLFKLLFFRLSSKLIIHLNYSKGLEYRLKSTPRYPKKFDIVIAYKISNIDIVLNSLYYIDSNKKVAWVHQAFNESEKKYIGLYKQFDKIFCVSEALKAQTVNMFPSLRDKTDVFRNIVNYNEIKKLSTDYLPKLKNSNDLLAIVTVGRLSIEKGQDIIPLIAYFLRNKGYNFVWYLVGEGPLETELKEKINQYNVTDCVMLCGRKDNPYPYIRNCDIYVQTSKTEGWGLTVSEAKILNKPIVTTNAGVMSEQIENGVNGIITENDSAEEICNSIEKLIINPDLRKTFVEVLEKDNTDGNKKEIQKLYSLIE